MICNFLHNFIFLHCFSFNFYPLPCDCLKTLALFCTCKFVFLLWHENAHHPLGIDTKWPSMPGRYISLSLVSLGLLCCGMSVFLLWSQIGLMCVSLVSWQSVSQRNTKASVFWFYHTSITDLWLMGVKPTSVWLSIYFPHCLFSVGLQGVSSSLLL